MYKTIKAAIDFLIALLLFPLLLILIIIIGLLIKIDDKGAIFYKPKRIGYKGRIFSMYKFRTMKENCTDIRMKDGSTYNSADDPRLTRVGRFLRKTSLDELPQILNILFFQMAIIGPRPDSAFYLEKYTQEERIILDVRPGITGYNQAINRNSVLTKEKIQNDMIYVRNMSFLFDIKIILMTIKTILFLKNVYRNESNEDKRLLILGASNLQAPGIIKAKDMGLYVGVVDYNSKAEGIKFADEYFNASTIDTDSIRNIVREFKPDGIMTLASDMPMTTIAKICEEFNLNSISYENSLKATNKLEMIKAFKENDVDSPWYYLIEKEDDLSNYKDKIIYPCIMKPTDNSGSRGVSLVNNENELLEKYSYCLESSRNGKILVEEYLQGEEVSVEYFNDNGIPHILAITDKKTTGAPHFVETGHAQQTHFKGDTLRKIKKLAIEAAAAVGIKGGPAHIEIMVTKNGPKMIELGARLGGDCITTHLVPLSTGIDMVKATINYALRKKTDLRQFIHKGSAIKYFFNKINTEKMDMCRKIKGCQLISVLRNEKISPEDVKSSNDRSGYIITFARNAKRAMKICEKIEKIL